MPELNSQNTWDWNCGSKNDLDYRIIWGNNGTLTIQRILLRSITYIMRCWNPIDGWIEKSISKSPPAPTSEPYTFDGIHHYHAIGKRVAHQYWGKSYTMIGTLVVIHGHEGALIDEDVVTTVGGCFTRNDPHYVEVFQGCIPPDVICE